MWQPCEEIRWIFYNLKPILHKTIINLDIYVIMVMHNVFAYEVAASIFMGHTNHLYDNTVCRSKFTVNTPYTFRTKIWFWTLIVISHFIFCHDLAGRFCTRLPHVWITLLGCTLHANSRTYDAWHLNIPKSLKILVHYR